MCLMGSSVDLSLSDATEGQSLAKEPFLGSPRGVVVWYLLVYWYMVITYSTVAGVVWLATPLVKK